MFQYLGYVKCPKISNILFHTFLANISIYMQLFLKTLQGITNSVDNDQQSNLGLHCLHMAFCQKLWCTKF